MPVPTPMKKLGSRSHWRHEVWVKSDDFHTKVATFPLVRAGPQNGEKYLGSYWKIGSVEIRIMQSESAILRHRIMRGRPSICAPMDKRRSGHLDAQRSPGGEIAAFIVETPKASMRHDAVDLV